MILNDFVFLAVLTARAQAYIQAMVKEQISPSLCIIYTENKDKCFTESEKESSASIYYDLNEPLLQTIIEHHISYRIIEEKDINSEALKKVIENLAQKYIIYSGYGGAILKKHLFSTEKIYSYSCRNSSKLLREYYRLFQYTSRKHDWGYSHFLNEHIDEGEVLASEQYPVPASNIDIDYLYEPWIKS